ncbi:MAG: DUF167 family protein [Bauldia sp.]
MACYRLEPDGMVLSVRLTPKAARDSVDGTGALSDGRIVAHVRVRTIPADGAANAALVTLLARTFAVPKSSVEIIGGLSARLKQVRIAGSPSALATIADGWPKK